MPKEIGSRTVDNRSKEVDTVQVFKVVQGLDNVKSEIWFRRLEADWRTLARARADYIQLE